MAKGAWAMQDTNASIEGQDVTLGERLRERRLEAGLTQEELAERAGLSARGVSDLERGLRRAPYRDTLRRLAEVLGIDATERRAWLDGACRARGRPAQDPPVPRRPTTIRRPAPGPESPSAEAPAPIGPAPALPPADSVRPRGEGPAGEHRSVTILSCQLAEGGRAGERFGADVMLSLMDRLVEQATDASRRYDGTLTAVSHDGFVAVFGAPIAHEDHARRAVLAALELQARLEAVADPQDAADVAANVGAVPMRTRIGLHSGGVAFGRIASPRNWLAAAGDTTDIAMALQRAATPGSIVLSDSTAEQVVGYIRLEPLEPVPMPGRSVRLAAKRVIGVGARRSPLEGLGARLLVPFVGRQPELAMLGDVLSHVVLGHGQVVGIVGEPGMGKSRLLFEFRHSLRTSAVTYLEGRCLSFGATTPYLPILDLVRANCGIQEGDPTPTVVERVRFALQEVGLEPERHLPFVLSVLGVADAHARLDSSLGPEIVKSQTFETLRTWALKGSETRPLVIALEDLHWIDPTSEDYLASLVESLPGARILLLCTWRPGYRPPWLDHSYVTQLALRRLGPEDSLSVVRSVLGTQHVPPLLARRMLERAEGNPLFLEELARAVVDQHDTPGTDALPETIQDVLLARMSRLPDVPRRVLQTASVIGREFSSRLLAAVWASPDPLGPQLQELKRQEFLHEQSAAGEPTFAFKHVLTQEAAYASLLENTRRKLHRRIAEVLAARSSQVADSRPELVAHHYTAAGLLEPATTWWQRAGERASQRSANAEALSHFRQALELLRCLPETADRARRELEIQVALLNGPVTATYGLGAAEAEAVYARARELAEQVGEVAQLFPLLFGYFVFHLARGDFYAARDVGQEILRLAEQQTDSTPLMLAHYGLGVVRQQMGELLVAKRHFATALARYEPERHQALAFGHLLFEPRLSMLAWQSIGLWLSGQLDESLRVSKLALAEALELGHVHTLAHMLFTAGIALEQARRDPAAVAPHLRRALRLMEDNQLSMFRAYATYDEGWLLAEHGQYDDGIARMHAGLEAMRTTGTGAFRPQFLGWLAWAYAQSGRIAPALGVLDEALRATESGGEHWWEAELYRLKGEALLLAGTDRTAAEAYLRSAIEVARRQQAVILELRAATSLYRALAHRGTGADAGDLVACALGRIQGGDATRDVCEARAVLAERVHS